MRKPFNVKTGTYFKKNWRKEKLYRKYKKILYKKKDIIKIFLKEIFLKLLKFSDSW